MDLNSKMDFSLIKGKRSEFYCLGRFNHLGLLLLIIFTMWGCSPRYRDVYVPKTYFYSIPNLPQKVNHSDVIVHAKNKSFRLVNPKMLDSVIVGIPMSIKDTNSTSYRHNITYNINYNNIYPIEVYLNDSATLYSSNSAQVAIPPAAIKQFKMYNSQDEIDPFKVAGWILGIALIFLVILLFAAAASFHD